MAILRAGSDAVNPMQQSGDQGTIVESAGPWPFITQKVALRAGGLRETVSARLHRKGLASTASLVEHRLLAGLWQPRRLNWWIGTVFALGAALFALGSVLSLAPELAHCVSMDNAAIGAVYFAGSIPFTTAAYLQLYQAANAPAWEAGPQQPPRARRWLGWRPRNIGWVSCALQFAGTLLFNINTFDGMRTDMGWLREDVAVWAPDVVGSVLFLASGYLAFAETCHRHFAWLPASLSWWVTSFNLLGCVAFMVSAVYAFVSPDPGGFGDGTLAVAFTLVGALGFLAGSLLMLPEAAPARA
ncbi:MAG: hypothetical protein R3E50_07250 [Halioglobus sp.]